MKCVLKPVEEGVLAEIELGNNQKVIVGRGDETGITAKRCSKKQCIKSIHTYFLKEFHK